MLPGVLNIVLQFDPVSVLHVYQVVLIVDGQDELCVAYPSYLGGGDQDLLARYIDQHRKLSSPMLLALVHQLRMPVLMIALCMCMNVCLCIMCYLLHFLL